MTDTPSSGRLHIVLTGERNSGKSSLLNALSGQRVSIVSDVPGTTTDHVSKAMEIPGLGACVLVDTAGLDDTGELGGMRVGNALDALRTADVLLVVIDAATGRLPDLPVSGVPAVPVLSKCELLDEPALKDLSASAEAKYGRPAVFSSPMLGRGRREVICAIQEAVPEDWNAPFLTSGLVEEGGLAVLVMPQDKQAPKGRLILPQQQVIRELLDRHCRVVCCTTGDLASTLASLKDAPDVVITDSQDFAVVSKAVPQGVRLTSFSILLAASKGDIDYFLESARKIDSLTASSRVLVAEACTHVPASEDIGRVRIPRLLRARAGKDLRIDTVSGRDFPDDIRAYDLVIHCGACMFNRRYVLSRVEQAKKQGVPMTNYGIAIAYINNLKNIYTK